MLLRVSLFLLFVFSSSAMAPRPPREGLDSLSDDALMNELASRGLETLLDRAFDVNQVPQAERAARRTLIALSRLTDPNIKLNATQREQIVADVVKGISLALPTIDDPQLLMRQSYVLITSGIERDVNTLEYWGDNPRTQAQLRPVVETVVKMLERAAALARQQADELGNRINNPSSPLVARFEEMEQLASTAEYTRQMVNYYLALSLDKSSGKRRQIADEAFNYLRQFDVEENPDRNLLRTRLAKLKMVRGDYGAAREIFDQVTDGAGAESRNVAIQYEARYFAAVTELLAKNLDASKKHLQDLLEWQEQNLPQQDTAARAGAEAASAMLRYRVHSLEAELARTTPARQQANAEAVKVLMDLLSRRPDLRGIIYEQLLPRMEEQVDLAQTDPLLLRAIVARGEEQLRAPTARIDKQALEQALSAAEQMVAKASQAGIDAQTVSSAQLLRGFFLDKLNRKPEAIAAFLDYVEKSNAASPNASLALDNAQALIGELRRAQRDDPDAVRLYERFLPLAISPPWSRTQFAYEYARRLQLSGKAADAVKYFRMVPDSDPRVLEARYFQLVALTQRLDEEELPPAERPAILADVQRLADEVRRAASAAAQQKDSTRYRLMLARTGLLAADLARRELKDPARAIALLSDFEQTAQGLPQEKELLADAMLIRVQSLMAQEKYTDATQQLVALLQRTQGAQGAQIVYKLLEKLNADFDLAQAAGDVQQMRVLAKNRAQLSGFLVRWAATNEDTNIRRYTYRYMVFDADTHRRAADLDPNPESRRAGLTRAREKYLALQSPQNIELYRQSLDSQRVDPDAPDPQVELGLALLEYDLGNLQAAADLFSQLLTSRRIGSPVNAVEDDGELKYVDNDSYWEVVYKLIRCNVQLNTGIEESKSFLKQQYITWGDRVGGRKWKEEFATLRRELIPEFDPQR